MRHKGAQGISLICGGAQGSARSDWRASSREESLGHALEGPPGNALEANAQRHSKTNKIIWNCTIECFSLA